MMRLFIQFTNAQVRTAFINGNFGPDVHFSYQSMYLCTKMKNKRKDLFKITLEVTKGSMGRFATTYKSPATYNLINNPNRASKLFYLIHEEKD